MGLRLQMHEPDAPSHAVRCLKHEGGRSAWLIERPGERRKTLKVWPLTPLLAVKLFSGHAQPQRQARGARLLAGAGLRTAMASGPWRLVRRPGTTVVELELEYLAGCSGLEWLEDGAVGAAERRMVGRLVGEMVAHIASSGLVHRDLKPSNVIIDHDETGPTVALIDTVAVRWTFHRAAAVANMLIHLAYVPQPLLGLVTRSLWMPILYHTLRPLTRRTRREIVRRIRRWRAGRSA